LAQGKNAAGTQAPPSIFQAGRRLFRRRIGATVPRVAFAQRKLSARRLCANRTLWQPPNVLESYPIHVPMQANLRRCEAKPVRSE
jgi:hypothetical protein